MHGTPQTRSFLNTLTYLPQIRHFLISFRNHSSRLGEGGGIRLSRPSKQQPQVLKRVFSREEGGGGRGRYVPPAATEAPNAATLQKRAVVPRIHGSKTFVSLDSRLESDGEEEEKSVR